MVSTKRVALLAVVLIAVLGALALFSLTVGMRAITLSGVLHALRSAGSQEPSDLVVWTLRLPRLLAALVCGVSFAVAGALMQGVTNNPLASPSILGINAGASFGLALATAFILVLASLKHGLTPVYIALAGTAVSAVFLAVTQVLVVFFDVAQELSYWTAGGISGIRMTAILGVVPWTILGLILAVSVSRSVTLLSFGEDMAIGLGGRLSRIRLRAGLAVLILAGSAVAVAGPVGFVGLVVPHITRRIVGIDYRLVVPFSALLGALLVLVADMVARTVAPPFEIPLGAVTALVGVPFFLYLANRKEVRG
ncbi:iron ABC transporter permease [Mitsuokella jalaludinii]|uniref:FecCD family ABC transporter permease n=1 Tax=Mitsuokella jalaludinii TaxID=187979 RepID=UPI0030776D2E